MPTKSPNGKTLHLPDLAISGFGGIRELAISRLGRVTLFAGKNGVGKTTLLDAVRAYATRGVYSVLADILQKREEVSDEKDEDGDTILAPNWGSLFYGRQIHDGDSVRVGSTQTTTQLRIRAIEVNRDNISDIERKLPGYDASFGLELLEVEVDGQRSYCPMGPMPYGVTRRIQGLPVHKPRGAEELPCESIGPALLNNEAIARYWDKIALTQNEFKVAQALNLIFEGEVERVAMVGNERILRYVRALEPWYGRRAVVKIAGKQSPVPLKSLGDGASRLLGIALALTSSQDGFLLIDEVENGIHHSIQKDFWTLVLQTAEENNVQVIATTHGWSCVSGFAYAASALPDIPSSLIRLERDGDEVRAVEYPSKDLGVIAEQGIEVR